MQRLVAVGLLRAAPRRMPQQVDAHAAVEGRAGGPHLAPAHVTDLFLERDVERRAARHGDGEGGAGPDDDAARTVREAEAGHAEARDVSVDERMLVEAAGKHVGEARPELRVAVEEPQPLLVGQPAIQRLGLVLDRRPAPDGLDGARERVPVVGGVSGHLHESSSMPRPPAADHRTATRSRGADLTWRYL